jgi:hypothetical protein
VPGGGRRDAGTVAEPVLQLVQGEREVPAGGHRRRPPADDGDRGDRLARQHPAGQRGDALEEGVERVLGEGEPAEFLEGRLDGGVVVLRGCHVLGSEGGRAWSGRPARRLSDALGGDDNQCARADPAGRDAFRGAIRARW